MSESRYKGSFSIGRLAGIPIRVHYLLPLAWVLQTAFTAVQATYTGRALAFAAIVYGPLLFLTVLIHELGHSLAARSVGGHADTILLWPLGGLAYCSHEAGPKADIWVTLAGPLTHVPQGLVWAALSVFTGHIVSGQWRINVDDPFYSDKSDFWHSLVATAFWMNVTVMLFNLLVPAYPLDGGRLLVDTLLVLGVSAETAAKVAIGTATVIGIALIIMGAIRIWFEVMGVFIGAFILFSAYGLWRTLEMGQISQHPLFSEGKPTAAIGMPDYNTGNQQRMQGPAQI